MPSAIEELWRVFDTLRSQADNPKAPTIHKAGLTRLRVDVPASTIRGWIGEKGRQPGELRRRVPRDEEQFIAVITVLRLLALKWAGNPVDDRTPITLSVTEKDDWLSRLRAAKAEEDATTQDGATGQDRTANPAEVQEPPSSEEPDVPQPHDPGSTPPRRRRVPMAVWVAAGLAAVAAAVVVTLQLSADDPPVAIYYKQGKVPTSSGPLPGGGPVVACPMVTTNEPDLVIEAEGGVAFAEYYRKNNLFLVYDNAPDGNSAILQLTAPSGSRTDWYNTKGHTCNGRKRPKAMVVGKAEPQDLARARVCVGEWGDRGQAPPEHCGKAVHLPPSGQNAREPGS